MDLSNANQLKNSQNVFCCCVCDSVSDKVRSSDKRLGERIQSLQTAEDLRKERRFPESLQQKKQSLHIQRSNFLFHKANIDRFRIARVVFPENKKGREKQHKEASINKLRDELRDFRYHIGSNENTV